jgi:hypothetical protein
MSDSKISDIFIKLNPYIKALLDSRFHGLLSHRLMLIGFQGRQSGREFITPVHFIESGDNLLIGLAEIKTRKWWRNYKAEWPMKVKFKGSWVEGQAKLLTPEDEGFQQEWEVVLSKKRMDAIFKSTLNPSSGLTQNQVADLGKRCGLVRFIPN